MISGMTGFGQAEISSGKIKAIIEIKSVNHRYLDMLFYLPTGFGSLEDKMRQIIQRNVQRGRVNISVKIIQKPSQKIILNKDAVKSYLNYADKLKREFKLENDIALSGLISLPGVAVAQDVLVDPAFLWLGLEKCLNKSLRSLVAMRRREGKSLAKDITDQIRCMLLETNKIMKKWDLILKEKKKNLTSEEFKSFQKSIDINEEMSRLNHYVQELKLLLKSKGSMGKKMDFIAQEMQRETNTIGSKLQDVTVSGAVIMLKSKIEKIREQAQNIE